MIIGADGWRQLARLAGRQEQHVLAALELREEVVLRVEVAGRAPAAVACCAVALALGSRTMLGIDRVGMNFSSTIN